MLSLYYEFGVLLFYFDLEFPELTCQNCINTNDCMQLSQTKQRLYYIIVNRTLHQHLIFIFERLVSKNVTLGTEGHPMTQHSSQQWIQRARVRQITRSIAPLTYQKEVSFVSFRSVTPAADSQFFNLVASLHVL